MGSILYVCYESYAIYIVGLWCAFELLVFFPVLDFEVHYVGDGKG